MVNVNILRPILRANQSLSPVSQSEDSWSFQAAMMVAQLKVTLKLERNGSSVIFGFIGTFSRYYMIAET